MSYMSYMSYSKTTRTYARITVANLKVRLGERQGCYQYLYNWKSDTEVPQLSEFAIEVIIHTAYHIL